MEQRGRRLTDAFVAALELRKHLREGTAFCDALTNLELQIETPSVRLTAVFSSGNTSSDLGKTVKIVTVTTKFGASEVI